MAPLCVDAYALIHLFLFFSCVCVNNHHDSATVGRRTVNINWRDYIASRIVCRENVIMDIVRTSTSWHHSVDLPSHQWRLHIRIKYAKSRVVYYGNSVATFNVTLLAQSGDVQLNPGPLDSAPSQHNRTSDNINAGKHGAEQ